MSRCSDSSSGRDDAGEQGEGGTSAGPADGGGDPRNVDHAVPAGRCPKCSSKDWTPPLDGGPGHCGRCGPVTCLEPEPGSNDVEDDVEVFE